MVCPNAQPSHGARKSRASEAQLSGGDRNGKVSSCLLGEVRAQRARQASRRGLLRGHHRRFAMSPRQALRWLRVLPAQEPSPQTSRRVLDTASKWRERRAPPSFPIPLVPASPPCALTLHSGAHRRDGSKQADSQPRSHRPTPKGDRTRRSKSGRWRGRAASGTDGTRPSPRRATTFASSVIIELSFHRLVRFAIRRKPGAPLAQLHIAA